MISRLFKTAHKLCVWLQVAADKAGWEALGPVLLDMLKKETKASASIEKTTEALKKLAESLPQGRAVWASVLSELGARLLALPMTQPQTAPYGLSYGYGSAYGHAAHAMLCTPAAFALLYRTLADMQLDDQVGPAILVVTLFRTGWMDRHAVAVLGVVLMRGCRTNCSSTCCGLAGQGSCRRCHSQPQQVQGSRVRHPGPPLYGRWGNGGAGRGCSGHGSSRADTKMPSRRQHGAGSPRSLRQSAGESH